MLKMILFSNVCYTANFFAVYSLKNFIKSELFQMHLTVYA